MTHISHQSLRLNREHAGLLIIDIQERLAGVMHSEKMAQVSRNTHALIEGSKALGLPIWVTEQYPKGIGPTLPELAQTFPANTEPVSKVEFSCAAVPAVSEMIAASGRKQLILCGMETHICVYQTARDFVEQGYQVFVPQDAVISRTEENRGVGLKLMERAGAVLSCTEAVLFDLLHKAGGPEFKLISALIK